MPDVTLESIIAAIRKDGKPQVTRAYWVLKDGRRLKFRHKMPPAWDDVESACAVGMASLILQVTPERIEDVVWSVVQTEVTQLNDGELMTYEEIADLLERRMKEQYDVKSGADA